MGRNRQQRQNVKARKAKARAAHGAVYRSWIDRRKARLRAPPGIGALGSAAAMMAMLSARQPTVSEQLLCEMFGEDYKP